MPKQKKSPPTVKSLEELISDYDRDRCLQALAGMESNDLGWQVLRAVMMKEYVSKMAYIMDYSGKTGKQIEAAYEAGSAQTLFDMANSIISKYKDVLQQKALVIEDVRPEE
jgi:hypothetical protein